MISPSWVSAASPAPEEPIWVATAESTLLADALPDIDFVATPGVSRPLPDLPLEVVNQWEFYEMVTNKRAFGGDSLTNALSVFGPRRGDQGTGRGPHLLGAPRDALG